jgi:hypothetical protein
MPRVGLSDGRLQRRKFVEEDVLAVLAADAVAVAV